MPDISYLTTLRVAPENAYQTEVALRNYFGSLAEEEFAAGGVEVFSIHRDPAIAGSFQIFEQYTSAGAACHDSGDLAIQSFDEVRARVIVPYERVLLEPVWNWGVDLPVGSAVTDHLSWRFTVRVAAASTDAFEKVQAEIFAAMDSEEFSTGDVVTYNVQRVAGDIGRYIMFEEFTTAGSAAHARGPAVRVPGRQMMRLLNTPYQRVPLTPICTFGIAHGPWQRPGEGRLGAA